MYNVHVHVATSFSNQLLYSILFLLNLAVQNGGQSLHVHYVHIHVHVHVGGRTCISHNNV